MLSIIFTAIMGLIIGSFINVVIYRLPLMLLQPASHLNLAKPSSHCPECEHSIRWRENIPVVSFLFLKGKCAYCGAKISWRYPLVELLTALAFVSVVLQLGLTWQGFAGLFFTGALISLLFIDLEYQLLPDEIIMPFLWVGLIVNTFHLFTSPTAAIIGAALGYSILWAVAYGFKWLRGIEGMGHGDFKLLALLGAWFGWQALLFIILFASLVGSIVGVTLIVAKKNSISDKIAFGPYLALAGWLALLFNQQIINFFRY